MARASLVAFYPIEPLGTHPFLTVDAFKARVAEAGPVDVVALGSVLTVTPLRTLDAVRPHRTLLLAPAEKQQEAVTTNAGAEDTSKCSILECEKDQHKWTRFHLYPWKYVILQHNGQ